MMTPNFRIEFFRENQTKSNSLYTSWSKEETLKFAELIFQKDDDIFYAGFYQSSAMTICSTLKCSQCCETRLSFSSFCRKHYSENKSKNINKQIMQRIYKNENTIAEYYQNIFAKNCS